ncbi:hypothetical protein FB567DRAFT_109590 [Paraphoma chrysanthemicola]|uniref:Uncharacterized protein n=1 Tax=Paraphoma chrysanthemicola TaxID=798071 RepID=A0A8K0R1D8_9PLEO|nr:hypothetical protein FB567DRAFT_109590 [Paraphoma chrysanthemicola]
MNPPQNIFKISGSIPNSVTMLHRLSFLALVLLAIHAHSALISHVNRQADCEQYGKYPEYKGPCETTNCGAGRINCLKQVPAMSRCLGYPAVGCPYMGCSCSNYAN